MQIQSFQNHSVKNQQKNPQFKSTYPVYHWIAEKAGQSYIPVCNIDLAKELQPEVIKFIKKKTAFSQSQFGEKVLELFEKFDIGYKFNKKIRSFTDYNGGCQGTFKPLVYLISGSDVDDFNKEYGKPIGKSIASGDDKEYRKALKHYVNGINFVKDPKKRIMGSDYREYALHTKFQRVRDVYGKVVGYELVDMKFLPETGKENPFVRLGYTNGK